jgi:rapamycin-insensitive companion of mTOR
MLLINNPKIRTYFRPQVDLKKIFSIFTRADGTDTETKKPQAERIEAQMKLAQRAIVSMMRSWQGVIYFTSSKLGLSSLVEALNQPIKM